MDGHIGIMNEDRLPTMTYENGRRRLRLRWRYCIERKFGRTALEAQVLRTVVRDGGQRAAEKCSDTHF